MLKALRRTCWAPTLLAALSAGCLAGCSDDASKTGVESSQNSLKGQLKRVVISDPDRGISTFEYFLELDDAHWLKLHLDAEPDLDANSEVLVTGERQGDELWVHSIAPAAEALERGDLGIVQEPLIAATPKKVAVVLFNFSNDTSQPIDLVRAKEIVFSGAQSSNAYFREMSYALRTLVGSVDVTGDIFGWYTIDQTNATCDYQGWGSAARTKAQAAGVNLTPYDHVIHYFPRATSCQFSGVGQLPGRYNWINASSSQTIAHELGHNFGVHHASSYRCIENGVPVPIGGTCTANEYGDPFDVMGSSYRHMNGYQKEKLGFLETTNIVTASASGSFTLSPLEQKTASPQVLRFPIPGSSDVYYVEYRQPFGFDNFRTTDPVSNGVLIHRITVPTRGVLQTKLIDNAPSTTSFTDSPLLVGRTFTDAAASISFTLTARTATSASVQVTFGGAPPPPPPPPAGCATGETEFGGHCYFKTTAAQAFSLAGTTCTGRGAGWRIASIESSAENAFVSTFVGSTDHWLSGTDAVTEGTFLWATGTAFWSGGATGAPPAGGYANFASGEPNDTGDCTRIISGGQWRDVSCTSTYRAVCEKG